MADNTTPTKKHKFNALLLLSVPLVCLGVFVFLALHSPSNSPTDEFVMAFVTADLERAKAVIAPQHWKTLAEAMKGRQPFHCPLDGWLNEDTGISGAGRYDGRIKSWTWGLGYQCASSSAPFCLDIHDIVVQEIEDQSKVVSWGKICEAHDYSYRCAEMCW